MDHKQGNQRREQSAQGPVLYVAFELANSAWKLACSDAPGHRSLRMVFGISLPGENPGRFLFLEPNPLISRMIA